MGQLLELPLVHILPDVRSLRLGCGHKDPQGLKAVESPSSQGASQAWNHNGCKCKDHSRGAEGRGGGRGSRGREGRAARRGIEREEDKNKEEKEQEENEEEEKKVLNKRKGMSRRRKRKTWDEGQERREGQGELMQNEMCELDHLITMPLGSSHTFALRDTNARQLAELRMQT